MCGGELPDPDGNDSHAPQERDLAERNSAARAVAELDRYVVLAGCKRETRNGNPGRQQMPRTRVRALEQYIARVAEQTDDLAGRLVLLFQLLLRAPGERKLRRAACDRARDDQRTFLLEV